MRLDVGFGQPLEEEVCLQCRPSTRWWIFGCDENLMDILHRTRDEEMYQVIPTYLINLVTNVRSKPHRGVLYYNNINFY